MIFGSYYGVACLTQRNFLNCFWFLNDYWNIIFLEPFRIVWLKLIVWYSFFVDRAFRFTFPKKLMKLTVYHLFIVYTVGPIDSQSTNQAMNRSTIIMFFPNNENWNIFWEILSSISLKRTWWNVLVPSSGVLGQDVRRFFRDNESDGTDFVKLKCANSMTVSVKRTKGNIFCSKPNQRKSWITKSILWYYKL